MYFLQDRLQTYHSDPTLPQIERAAEMIFDFQVIYQGLNGRLWQLAAQHVIVD